MKNLAKLILSITLLHALLTSCTQKPSAKDELLDKINATFKTCDGNYAMVFADLTDGDTIFIQPKKKYHAASTMKIPVMMEIYDLAENGVFSLEDSIDIINEFKSIVDGSTYQLSTDDDSDQDIYGKIGQRTTIKALVYDMITMSSNLATNILIELADAKKITQSMRDLGAMDIEVLRGVEDNLAYQQGLSNSTTAHDSYLILKALAEQTVGTSATCNEMINILKEQKFNEIIPAYLPENVEVAHKTGVITALHHDMGIVYLPNGRSYILVLLSEKMEDFDACTDMMAMVSKFVYDYVESKP